MKKYKFIYPILLMTFFFNCKKNHDRNIQFVVEEKQVDEFSEETIRILDNISSVEFKLDDIVLPNGQTIKEFNSNITRPSSLSVDVAQKLEDMQIFKDMATRAIYLATKSNFDIKEDEGKLDNSYTNPAQNGLAYVWSGKTELSRTPPLTAKDKKGNEILLVTCNQNLFGFDCAGYLETILKAGKVYTPNSDGFYNANQLRDPMLINKFISDNNIKGLKVINLGTDNKVIPQTGDIVYGGYKEKKDKKTGNIEVIYEHIGIALKRNDGTVGVFQSNGAPSKTCEENTTLGRGARGLNLDEYKYYFSGKIGYLRFVTDNSLSIENITPNPLYGNINEYISDPIRVRIVDAAGNGYEGAIVSFQVKTGGGSVEQNSVTTLPDGYAETKWKAGSVVGTQTLEILAVDKDNKPISGSPVTYTLIASADEGTFTDPRDGQTYTFKKIGTQVWMTKNLNYVSAGSSCYNDQSSNCETYGRLYEWNAALTAAPPGWHLPTASEWSQMYSTYSVPYALMATTGWVQSGTTNLATNASGFSAFPAGEYAGAATPPYFGAIGTNAFFWTSTPADFFNIWERAYCVLIYNNYLFYGSGTPSPRINRYSVRCVRD